MTTIRERFTAALRDDIRSAISNAYYENRGKGQTMETAADAAADAVLAIIARRLDFATAWDESVAECKRLGFKGPDLMHHEDYTGRLSWIADAGYAPEGVREWGATPTDALVALTEALRERAR